MKSFALSQDEAGKRLIYAAVLWIAGALISSGTARANIYTWTDAEGVIHYSNQNAPRQAQVYIKVATPDPNVALQYASPDQEENIDDVEIQRDREQTQAKLEETNRKLNLALERVDELTEKVSDSQARAAAAAEAADQAAIAAENQAVAAAQYQYQSKVKERVIVYSSPYPYRYKKHGIKHRKPYNNGYPKKYYRHDKPDRFRKHYPKFRDKHRHKLDRSRHTGKRHNRTLPYWGSINKSYGARDRVRGGAYMGSSMK